MVDAGTGIRQKIAMPSGSLWRFAAAPYTESGSRNTTGLVVIPVS